jgi:hypothetical protein
MAKITEWIMHDRKFDPLKYPPIKPTTEKYQEIKDLGLETVAWIEYSSLTKNNFKEIAEFIKVNKPCLFIYDPKTSEYHKGFLFNVESMNPVISWIDKSSTSVDKFNYLVTTQITNPYDGFVGTVRCDGKGKMMATTLHYPGICNQREVTEPTKDYTGYWNDISIDETGIHSSWASTDRWMKSYQIKELIETYMHREGYFEFINGYQSGRRGLFTIGYEKGGAFGFDSQIYQLELTNTTALIRGKLLKESN